MKNYTDKKYWDEYWEKETRQQGEGFQFDELLHKYIQWDNLKSYIEIGGVPGSIMAHMKKAYGLEEIATVDFSDKVRIEQYLKKCGITEYDIFDMDFMEFEAEKLKGHYDIVASWGFIEHFERNVAANFIDKKKKLVSEHGYLVMELPNIRKIMWFLYWVFNREVIKTHNLTVMDLGWLKSRINDGGGFEVKYASYYFSVNTENVFFKKHSRLRKICEWLVAFFKDKDFPDNIKAVFFPYIVVIAKRKGGNFFKADRFIDNLGL